MTTLEQIASTIIKEQEPIIGPLAWEQAGNVKGLHIINKDTGEVSIEETVDGKAVIDDLVGQYEILFGEATRRVSKNAVADILKKMSADEIPKSLR